MKKESQAILLRIFIGESDRYNGKSMYIHILEMLKNEGIAGATVFRGIAGFGKHSRFHTTFILQLSTDLPILIEIADLEEKIDKIKPKLFCTHPLNVYLNTEPMKPPMPTNRSVYKSKPR